MRECNHPALMQILKEGIHAYVRKHNDQEDTDTCIHHTTWINHISSHVAKLLFFRTCPHDRIDSSVDTLKEWKQKTRNPEYARFPASHIIAAVRNRAQILFVLNRLFHQGTIPNQPNSFLLHHIHTESSDNVWPPSMHTRTLMPMQVGIMPIDPCADNIRPSSIAISVDSFSVHHAITLRRSQSSEQLCVLAADFVPNPLCTVCLETIDISRTVSTPCYHIVCHACVRTLISSYHATTHISCPTCREKTHSLLTHEKASVTDIGALQTLLIFGKYDANNESPV
jgi:hypothetical protein